MTLSLLCCSGDAPSQVAAVLAPLRHAVDEVVLCVAAGGPPSAAYAGLADRVVRLDEPDDDAGHAWPYGACRGDWVLRIDGDEVASAELIGSLRSLAATPGLLQVWLPTRRVLPDGRSWVRARPWWPGHEPRLVRNDGTTLIAGPPPGRPAPALPARYAEAPVYRLDLIEGDVPADTATAPTDERDVAAVAALLAAGPRGAAPAPPAARDLGEAAYAAAVQLFDDEVALRVAPGETFEVAVRVENLGTATWPWGLAQEPLIRVAYHLRDRTAGFAAEGPRSPLPESVAPGASAIVPVTVVAPPRPGDYELAIDLVHEAVRWFHCPAVARLIVGAGERPDAPLAPPRDPTGPPYDLLTAKHDFPRRGRPGPPERPYVVLATPRSGSTLLCRALVSTGIAAAPAEYLNPIHREDLRRRWGTGSSWDEYLEELFALRTAPDGVFGLKVHWEQLALRYPELGDGTAGRPRDGLLERLLPGARYVRIVRADHDRQTVSFWRAVNSGRWAVTDAMPAEQEAETPYVFEHLLELRRSLEHSELAWERYLRLNDLSAHTVLYEDLAADYEGTVRGVLAYLGLDDTVAIPQPALRVQRDERSARILERFRADCAAL